MMETPTISSSSYALNTFDAGAWLAENAQKLAIDAHPMFAPETVARRWQPVPDSATLAGAAIARQLFPEKKEMANTRLVRVIIADPNLNLPIDKRLLHSGAEQLTDLTDQELFFAVEINTLLKAHNDVRSKTRDKAASEKAGRDVFLEPVRIRDLRMHVISIAEF